MHQLRTRYRLEIHLQYVEDVYDDMFVFVFEAHHDEEAKKRAGEILVAYPKWETFTLSREAWDQVQHGHRGAHGRDEVLIHETSEVPPFRQPRQ